MAGLSSSVATLFVLTALLWRVGAVVKRWYPDTNFDNPQNWDLGRLPCPGDTIFFPTTAPEIFFPQDYTVSSMVLPTNGALILAADLTLVFNDNPTKPDPPEQCTTGAVIRFNHTRADAWLNPASWCIPLHDFDTDCLSDPQLDTEYVPCVYDDVLFPRESSYFASLDLSQTFSIRSLTIDNTYHTTDSFRDYVDTSEGKRRFTGTGLRPMKLDVQGLWSACDDPSGCYCGNGDGGHVNQVICSYRTCQPTLCPYPFTPAGHCCPICGSKMEFDYDLGNDTAAGFDEAQFRMLLVQEYIGKKDENYNLVKVILSKLINGRVQLVLVDIDSGKQAAPMGDALMARLSRDTAFKQQAGIVRVYNFARASASDQTTLASQTTPNKGEPTSQPGEVRWPPTTAYGSFLTAEYQTGLVAAAVGGAVVLLLVALAVVFYRTRRYKRPALDNLAVSINFDDLNEPVTVLRGMANPTYNTALPTAAAAASESRRDYVVSVSFADRESPSSVIHRSASADKKKRGSKQTVGLENPMYNAYDGNDSTQETSITTTTTTSGSAAATAATTAVDGSGESGKKKKRSSGLSNPLYQLQASSNGGGTAARVDSIFVAED